MMSLFERLFGQKKQKQIEKEPNLWQELESLKAEKAALEKWMAAEGIPEDEERLAKLKEDIENIRRQLPRSEKEKTQNLEK